MITPTNRQVALYKIERILSEIETIKRVSFQQVQTKTKDKILIQLNIDLESALEKYYETVKNPKS